MGIMEFIQNLSCNTSLMKQDANGSQYKLPSRHLDKLPEGMLWCQVS